MNQQDNALHTWNSRGFAVVPDFLRPRDLEVLLQDFEQAPRFSVRLEPWEDSNTITYDAQLVSRETAEAVSGQIARLSERVSAVTGVRYDMVVAAYFWDNQQISFSNFHQDFEPYWLFQDPTQYLNVYIPLIKPDASKSNLDLLPHDNAQRLMPNLVGVKRGPHEIFRRRERYVVQNISDGTQTDTAADVEALVACPHLALGDALVLRGDSLHRTQDTSTRRVAVSFRLTNSQQLIKYSDFSAGGAVKLKAIATSRRLRRAFSLFVTTGATELRAREVFEAVCGPTEPAPLAIERLTDLIRTAERTDHQARAQ